MTFCRCGELCNDNSKCKRCGFMFYCGYILPIKDLFDTKLLYASTIHTR